MRFILLLLVLAPFVSMGQTVCSQESRERLNMMLSKLSQEDNTQKTMNELMVEIGLQFLNTPYLEKTLEVSEDEKLVINLVGLDCTTFLESVMAMARIVKSNRPAFREYERELEFIRYRAGTRKEYPSRLHYFSDWIYDNQQKGVLSDITKDIGGEMYANHPSFMSSHPASYSQLADVEFVEQIKLAEAAIATREYYYLPKTAVRVQENKIMPGDLIAITIALENLDVSHVGIAIKQNGRIHLLHASLDSKKVEISEKPLSDYLMSHKSQSGIMVCRLREPE